MQLLIKKTKQHKLPWNPEMDKICRLPSLTLFLNQFWFPVSQSLRQIKGMFYYITYIQGSESSFIIALQLLYSDFITSF